MFTIYIINSLNELKVLKLLMACINAPEITEWKHFNAMSIVMWTLYPHSPAMSRVACWLEHFLTAGRCIKRKTTSTAISGI
jgi:hypothetical protein